MIMRKSIIFITLLLLLAPRMEAQKKGFLFGHPTRKQLQQENDALKASLDSLQTLLDSFEQRRYLEDSELIAVMEGNDWQDNTVEYTAEMSDSLLQLWYQNSTIADYDIVHEYDMDSVRFDSKVSDEVLIKRIADMNS